MARSAEKAMTALGRWYQHKQDEKRGIDPTERRPYNIEALQDVRKCERWRRDCIRDLSRKMSSIQNAGLGEFRIRDLNDDINKLLREKARWEEHIARRGGRRYHSVKPAELFDEEGHEIPGNRGYRYFGAAKDLPGVKELLEKPASAPTRRTRGQLAKRVDADYYGYRDEDDGEIVPKEREAELLAEERLEAAWRKQKESGRFALDDDDDGDDEAEDDDLYAKFVAELPPEEVELHMLEGEKEAATNAAAAASKHEAGSGKDIVPLDVPSQEQIEQVMIRQKKQELLELYASASLKRQSEEARALLGFVDNDSA